jgi:hypothetical protein
VKKSTKTHTRAHFMIARSTRILFLLSQHIHRAHLPFFCGAGCYVAPELWPIERARIFDVRRHIIRIGGSFSRNGAGVRCCSVIMSSFIAIKLDISQS